MNYSASTPSPPYYAVIFTSLRMNVNDGYDDTAERMVQLAERQPGYLGHESFRDEAGFGVTISYWSDTNAIMQWKQQSEHLLAQKTARQSGIHTTRSGFAE